MNECSAYVGLDVHKDTIAVAVALPGREEPVYRGEIKNQRKSLLRLIRSRSPDAEVLSFCYEAGPCGYGVYREIIDTGHYCEVVAPSLIPRRAGERVKTDRRVPVHPGTRRGRLSGVGPFSSIRTPFGGSFLRYRNQPSPRPRTGVRMIRVVDQKKTPPCRYKVPAGYSIGRWSSDR